MTVLIRKLLRNVRTIVTCGRLVDFIQTKRRQSVKLLPVLTNNRQHISKKHSFRKIYTTHVNQKIVAFNLSDIGEGIREVVIKEWFVKVGDRVQQFDNICEVQSDKAAVTITSRYDGIVTKLYHGVDQTALVGQPLVDIQLDDVEDTDSTETPVITEIVNKEKEDTTHDKQKVRVLTTPAVRRIAAQFKVDLSTVKSTGRNGRILKEDLLSYLNINAEKSNEISAEAVSVTAMPIPSSPQSDAAEDKITPITGYTKAMVKSMTEAMKIPHFVYSEEYNVTKLVEIRKQLKIMVEKYELNFTYMPIIIKAASLSLKQHPILNTSLDEKCENLIYKARHNIGVAMDTPNGLVVPVIKDIQKKNILEIALELKRLQEKGQNGTLGLNDLSDGTFTLSNIGIIGGTYTKPVILSPQVSIGAFGRIQVLPRYDPEGNLTKTHILTASWSADHRVVDGVTMAKFSATLKTYLENPYALLLDL